jgi:hypothetical protein
MTATFTRNGKTFTGKIVSRGYHNVDAPEGVEIELDRARTIWVPVSECQVD